MCECKVGAWVEITSERHQEYGVVGRVTQSDCEKGSFVVEFGPIELRHTKDQLRWLTDEEILLYKLTL